MPSITVIRHPKERRSKCSLTPLETRGDIRFLKFRQGWTFDQTGFTVLALGYRKLSIADAGRPLLLLDSTWRLLPQLEKCLIGKGVYRTLPQVAGAFPRKSKIATDPDGGLASVEALYLAKLLLGERDDTLLENYHWRSEFLENLNRANICEPERTSNQDINNSMFEVGRSVFDVQRPGC